MSLIGCSSTEPTATGVVDDDCGPGLFCTEQNTCACTTDDLCELALGEGYFATTLAAVRFAHRAWATKTVKKAKSATPPMAVNASRPTAVALRTATSTNTATQPPVSGIGLP